MDVKVFLNNGEVLSNSYFAHKYLTEELGFTDDELKAIIGEATDYNDQLKATQDAYHEYERLYDGVCVDMRGMVNELEEVVQKLKSGKSGRGYTKLDLARDIETTIHNFAEGWL